MALSVSDIRQQNTSRIFHSLRDHPGSSQRDLVERTGLDQATVSVIVNALEADGLLERTPRPSRGRVGRPQAALTISREAGILIGASLEPNVIHLIATTLAGDPLERCRLPGSRSVEGATERLEQGVALLGSRLGVPTGHLRGLGVGVPAIVDDGGRVLLAPNLDWRQVPFLERLRTAFASSSAPPSPTPVYLENDANISGLAERLFGAGRELDDFVYLAGHSGIGGALFLAGRLYRGAAGLGGEIGHMKVVPDGRPCACGARGCLETYASEAALVRRLVERGVDDLGDLDAIAGRALAGDPAVGSVLDEAAGYLGRAIADLINLLNPQAVVLGGSLALLAEHARPTIEREVQRLGLDALRRGVGLIVSPLGDDAVPMGGIALAMEGFLAARQPNAQTVRTELR